MAIVSEMEAGDSPLAGHYFLKGRSGIRHAGRSVERASWHAHHDAA